MSEKPYTTSARCGIMHLDDHSIAAIEAIIKRGNNAEVRKKGEGFIVLEVTKKIKYSPGELESGKSNRS